MHAFVVLGDVVGSREIDDREAFRETILRAIDGANERYADDVVGTFTLVKGVDEIAGVIAHPRNLYRILRDTVSSVRPGAIRFAVVYGEIDVGTTGVPAAEMDGPAFHRADEALGDVATSDLYVAFDGPRPHVDPLIGASINLLLMAREDWTDRQRTMVAAYEETGTQEAVADRLQVSQQTVSSTLRRADWARIARLEDVVNGALADYGGDDGTEDDEPAVPSTAGVEDGPG